MTELVNSLPFEAFSEIAGSLGAIMQPLIVFAIFKLVSAWARFDKSISLLSKSVEDLTKRIDRMETKIFKD